MSLATRIQDLDFDTVFRVIDNEVIEVKDEYAPTVTHDPDNDVYIDVEGWDCLTGMTGQYRYHGAVMHPSEFVGTRIAERIADYADEVREAGGDVVFALVAVNDDETDENGETDSIGWAIVYRESVSSE